MSNDINWEGLSNALRVFVQALSEVSSIATTDMEEGDSPTIGINENHRNIIELNYISLGEVIKSIINGIQNGYVRKTKGEMKKILANAYLDSKLDIKKLKPSMYSDIQKAVASRAQDR